jgi:hypothetical protein
MIKPTFRANFESGEGSIGNLEKFRESHNALMRADLLQDWVGELTQEYEIAIKELYNELNRQRK